MVHAILGDSGSSDMLSCWDMELSRKVGTSGKSTVEWYTQEKGGTLGRLPALDKSINSLA